LDDNYHIWYEICTLFRKYCKIWNIERETPCIEKDIYSSVLCNHEKGVCKHYLRFYIYCVTDVYVCVMTCMCDWIHIRIHLYISVFVLLLTQRHIGSLYYPYWTSSKWAKKERQLNSAFYHPFSERNKLTIDNE